MNINNNNNTQLLTRRMSAASGRIAGAIQSRSAVTVVFRKQNLLRNVIFIIFCFPASRNGF